MLSILRRRPKIISNSTPPPPPPPNFLSHSCARRLDSPRRPDRSTTPAVPLPKPPSHRPRCRPARRERALFCPAFLCLFVALASLSAAAPTLAQVGTTTVSRAGANSTSFSVSNDTTGGHYNQMHYVLVNQFDRFVFRFHPHLRQRVEHLVVRWADVFKDDHRQRRQVHLHPRHNRPDHRYASDPYTHENFWSLKRFYHFYLGVVAGIGHGGKLLESRNQAKRD